MRMGTVMMQRDGVLMKKIILLILLCFSYIIGSSSCSADNEKLEEYYNTSNIGAFYGNLAASHRYTADSNGIYYCENNAVYYISADDIENAEHILTANDEFSELDNIFLYHSNLYICNQEDNSFWRYHIESEILEKTDIALPDDHLIYSYFIADRTLFVVYAYWEGISCIDLETSEMKHYEDLWGQVSYADGKIYILNDALTVIDMADDSVYEIDLKSDNTEMYNPVKLYVFPQEEIYVVMEDILTKNNLLFLYDEGSLCRAEGYNADMFLFENDGRIYYTAESFLYSFDVKTQERKQIMQEPKGYIFPAGDYLCSEEGDSIRVYLLAQK